MREQLTLIWPEKRGWVEHFDHAQFIALDALRRASRGAEDPELLWLLYACRHFAPLTVLADGLRQAARIPSIDPSLFHMVVDALVQVGGSHMVGTGIERSARPTTISDNYQLMLIERFDASSGKHRFDDSNEFNSGLLSSLIKEGEDGVNYWLIPEIMIRGILGIEIDSEQNILAWRPLVESSWMIRNLRLAENRLALGVGRERGAGTPIHVESRADVRLEIVSDGVTYFEQMGAGVTHRLLTRLDRTDVDGI